MRRVVAHVLALVSCVASAVPQDVAAVQQVLTEHCVDCHGGDQPEAGLDLTRAPDPLKLRGLTTWRRIRNRVRNQQMPPAGYTVLEPDEIARVTAFVDAAVRAAPAWLPADPWHVTARRLSRSEYDRATFDLLGVSTELISDLPADDLSYGFDNLGDARTMSALHLEKYLAAAEDLAAQVIDTEDPRRPTVRQIEAANLRTEHRARRQEDGVLILTSNSEAWTEVVVPRSGEYELRVRTAGDQAGDQPPQLTIAIDGQQIAEFAVPETPDQFAVKTTRQRLSRGRHELALSFTNDLWEPKHEDPRRRDRNLHFDWLQLVGPLDAIAPPAGSAWWLGRDPGPGPLEERVEAVLRPLLERAWRRRITPADLQPLLALVRTDVRRGQSFAAALRLALTATLTSPWFLFRIEDTDHLDDYQLATRLAFFLWSSLPDSALLEQARAGALRSPAAIEAQVRRMLRDPRAVALATNFAAQWLELRGLAEAAPDPERFPGIDEALRRDLRRESELLFAAVLTEQRDVRELLTADFTFVNDRLARHYGIEGPADATFERQPTPAHRRGLLGHAGILLLTSQPTRTSVVKRGKWILDNILGAPPPAPPPGSDSFRRGATLDDAPGLRAEMARHRRDDACVSCHATMDELGFALEQFDPIGQWRSESGGIPIDASGELPGGRRVRGLAELSSTLAADPAFVHALTTKLFVYAVGRQPSEADAARLEALVLAMDPQPITLEHLILAIVKLPAFHGGVG